jgi:hypothetical protein
MTSIDNLTPGQKRAVVLQIQQHRTAVGGTFKSSYQALALPFAYGTCLKWLNLFSRKPADTQSFLQQSIALVDAGESIPNAAAKHGVDEGALVAALKKRGRREYRTPHISAHSTGHRATATY